jgi:hypothetical protein
MFNWIRSLFAESSEENILDLRKKVQGLRLELEERDKMIADLKRDLARQRDGSSARVKESVQGQEEQVLAEAATPIAQLLTQAHLLEVEARLVQAKDVLAVAKRLVRVFVDRGLQIVGDVGETVSFNPDQHEPLSAAALPALGERVVVRFVGLAYQGKLLRKAGVEKVEV